METKKMKFIKYHNNFELRNIIENYPFNLPNQQLYESDLLLLPTNYGDVDHRPSFMIGTYELVIRFKEENPDYKIQPIYSESEEILKTVFCDINFYIGSFILTSIIAPIFVNWLYDKWKKKNTEKENINIYINVIIHDKKDNFSTEFISKKSIECFKNEYISTIETYCHLKNKSKLNDFIENYKANIIDEEV